MITLIRLSCSCCGRYTLGRQWFNRDKGYGLCTRCIEFCKRGETDASFRSMYGDRGVHYDLESKKNEV